MALRIDIENNFKLYEELQSLEYLIKNINNSSLKITPNNIINSGSAIVTKKLADDILLQIHLRIKEIKSILDLEDY